MIVFFLVIFIFFFVFEIYPQQKNKKFYHEKNITGFAQKGAPIWPILAQKMLYQLPLQRVPLQRVKAGRSPLSAYLLNHRWLMRQLRLLTMLQHTYHFHKLDFFQERRYFQIF